MAELTGLKATLRCLVVSSAVTIDCRTLGRDFKNMEGEHIPLHKFGYTNLTKFLKERCSDVFLFSGDPLNPTLTPIITERTKHINEMVSKQRMPSNKCRPKRRSVLETKLSSPPSRHSQPFGKKYDTNTQSSPKSRYQNETFKTKEPLQVVPDPNWSVQRQSSKVERQPVENTRPMRAITKTAETHSINKTQAEMAVPALGSRYNVMYLNKVKSQLQELMKEFNEVLWLEDLNELYSEYFEEDIDYSRLGYTDLAALCRDLPDLLRLEASGVPGRLKVAAVDTGEPESPEPDRINHKIGRTNYTESEPPRTPVVQENSIQRRPSTVDQKPPKVEYKPNIAPKYRSQAVDLDLSGDSDDALPGVPYDKGIFPEDCMGHRQTIPGVSVSQLERGVDYEIDVSEVGDPSHFWFMLRGEEHDLVLDKYMAEMTEYYNKGEGRTRTMEFGAVQVGQYCATEYVPDGWHRSVIVRLLDADQVKVRHIDYGSVVTVHRSGLRVLPLRWSKLPAQAIRGCLANIRPAAGQACWPCRAAERLHQLVYCVPLVAQVYSVDVENNVARLFLADTTKDEIININVELVNSKVAAIYQMDPDILEDFMLPSFDDLERGIAMNLKERQACLLNGLPDRTSVGLPIVIRTKEMVTPPREDSDGSAEYEQYPDYQTELLRYRDQDEECPELDQLDRISDVHVRSVSTLIGSHSTIQSRDMCSSASPSPQPVFANYQRKIAMVKPNDSKPTPPPARPPPFHSVQNLRSHISSPTQAMRGLQIQYPSSGKISGYDPNSPCGSMSPIPGYGGPQANMIRPPPGFNTAAPEFVPTRLPSASDSVVANSSRETTSVPPSQTSMVASSTQMAATLNSAPTDQTSSLSGATPDHTTVTPGHSVATSRTVGTSTNTHASGATSVNGAPPNSHQNLNVFPMNQPHSTPRPMGPFQQHFMFSPNAHMGRPNPYPMYPNGMPVHMGYPPMGQMPPFPPNAQFMPPNLPPNPYCQNRNQTGPMHFPPNAHFVPHNHPMSAPQNHPMNIPPPSQTPNQNQTNADHAVTLQILQTTLGLTDVEMQMFLNTQRTDPETAKLFIMEKVRLFREREQAANTEKTVTSKPEVTTS